MAGAFGAFGFVIIGMCGKRGPLPFGLAMWGGSGGPPGPLGIAPGGGGPFPFGIGGIGPFGMNIRGEPWYFWVKKIFIEIDFFFKNASFLLPFCGRKTDRMTFYWIL